MFFNLPIDDNSIIDAHGNKWGDVSTKIYNTETDYNAYVISNAHESFTRQFPELFENFEAHCINIPAFSTERMLSAMRAITHDLLRYATYHRVDFIKSQCRYNISKSIRGATFAKWMTTFRPYNFDCLDCASYPNEYEAKYCNEFAANIFSSHALSLKSDDGKPIYIDECMNEPEEILTYLYTLRYRIKHQDVYSLFSRRLSESY